MKLISQDYLDELTSQASTNPRLRQHRNLHQSYDDPCQRLLNAIELGSYIQPHRHLSEPRDELLVAVRGLMALIKFDDEGNTTQIARLGTKQFDFETFPMAEVLSGEWHTVVALTAGCILLEIKRGPFDPNQRKDLAHWAPEENTREVSAYLKRLEKECEL